MKMRRIMFIEVHKYFDTQESTYFWHYVLHFIDYIIIRRGDYLAQINPSPAKNLFNTIWNLFFELTLCLWAKKYLLCLFCSYFLISPSAFIYFLSKSSIFRQGNSVSLYDYDCNSIFFKFCHSKLISCAFFRMSCSNCTNCSLTFNVICRAWQITLPAMWYSLYRMVFTVWCCRLSSKICLKSKKRLCANIPMAK